MFTTAILTVVIFGQAGTTSQPADKRPLTQKERYLQKLKAVPALKLEIEAEASRLRDIEEELTKAREEVRSAEQTWDANKKYRDKWKELEAWPRYATAHKKLATLKADRKASKERLSALRLRTLVATPPLRLYEDLSIGRIGTIEMGKGGRLEVLQIVSEKEMLVTYTLETFHSRPVPLEDAIAGRRDSWTTVDVQYGLLIKGVSTEGIVTGRKLVLKEVFEVADTRTYPTAIGGSNTVFVLEPLHLDSPSERNASKPVNGRRKPTSGAQSAKPTQSEEKK